jgi:GTP pyrophosphokinase
MQRLLPPEQLAAQPTKDGSPDTVSRLTEIFKKVAGRASTTGVRINGIDDILVRFGRCCNPVPGDPIVGFITRGRGVTVHTLECEKVLSTDAERRVDVTWDVKGEFKRPVTVRVLTSDRPGLLAAITQTFSTAGVNISQANCRITGDDRAVNTFEVSISDLKQLRSVMSAIGKIKGVHSVERV